MAKTSFLVREVDESSRIILREAAKARSINMGDMLGKFCEVYKIAIENPTLTAQEVIAKAGIKPVTR